MNESDKSHCKYRFEQFVLNHLELNPSVLEKDTDKNYIDSDTKLLFVTFQFGFKYGIDWTLK